MKNWVIRLIKKEDNQAVAKLIRSVFDEMEIPKVGTAYEDPYLDLMFEEYNKPKSAYFVVENEGKIVGCAGIAPLENGDSKISELQKMYFLPLRSRVWAVFFVVNFLLWCFALAFCSLFGLDSRVASI